MRNRRKKLLIIQELAPGIESEFQPQGQAPPTPGVAIPLRPSGFEGLAARLRRAGGWVVIAMLGWPTKTGNRIEARSHNPPSISAPITDRKSVV